MRKIALAILFTLITSPAWATTYYLAPASGGGNDSNNGTSASAPWLTPNHAVTCGDTITATASASYLAANFQSGHWGTVTCPAGNNVAWLNCATFAACKINSSSGDGIAVTASYWGVQGWEVTTSGVFAGCFSAKPPDNATTVHHIIFANDIANGCSSGGVVSYIMGTGSVDYLAFVGNIVYNGAQDGSYCYSGISIFEPHNVDALPGTHIYIAGNLTYNNVEPNPCAGGIPTDGEGIILDTFDAQPYTGQTVVDNNIAIFNGRAGFETGGRGTTSAKIYFRHNTAYGNNTDSAINNTACGGDMMFLAGTGNTSQAEMFFNLSRTSAATGCNGSAYYAFFVYRGDGTDNIYNNWGYGVGGNNTSSSNSGTFSFGTNNTLGVDPVFANATDPGAPSCGGFTSVPACMATVIANFTPTVAAAKAYGYQIPLTTAVYDPLFPRWLCNVNLPTGLVTMGCLAASSLPASPTITRVTVQ